MESARAMVNEGRHADALSALRPLLRAGRGSDPWSQGALRLAGCLHIVLGRVERGLTMLERSRRSGVSPRFPSMPYHRSFGGEEDRVRRVAIGLLECLGLGLSAAESAGRASAFTDVATLFSTRLLELALRDAGRPEDARLARRYFRRWLRAALADASAERAESLSANLAGTLERREDPAGARMVRRLAARVRAR